MTLNVPFDQFTKTIERVLGTKEAYVAANGSGCLISAAVTDKGFIVVSRSEWSPAGAKSKLEQQGVKVFEGNWSLAVDSTPTPGDHIEPYVVAVAYRSGETTPGVWLDAFASMPTQIQVLRAMYEEFKETGELPEVSFEEFVRLSDPNVVIVSPNNLQSFLDKKQECP